MRAERWGLRRLRVGGNWFRERKTDTLLNFQSDINERFLSTKARI